jgi:hypothetical protein
MGRCKKNFLLVIDYEEKKRKSKLNAIALNFMRVSKSKS